MSKLAIDGGTPVRTDPWPARLQIDDREINAVMELMTAKGRGRIRPLRRHPRG